MHSSRVISCVMWKDKCPVLLLSTHAKSVESQNPFVLRRNGAVRERIVTSLVLLEYTNHMREVDVANQLQASYSSQTWSHNWWHCIFWFLVDTSIVNMYVMHLDWCKHSPTPTKPMTHLEFKSKLCYSLLQFWET